MAAPLSPDRLIQALEKWDVQYKLYPGWKTRTRPGGCNPIGLIWHHTGGGSESDNYLEFLFDTGRPAEGIPGPLCQFAIAADGDVWVGSVGRANHAGMGSSSTRSKISNENYPGYSSEISPGPDEINGNPIYWGIEFIYAGTSPMTTAAYRSGLRLSAALMDAYGWSALSTFGHREHSRRKWDPGQVDLAKVRRDIRDLLAAGTGGGTPEEDDFDMRTDAQIEQLVKNAIAAMKPEIQDAAADGMDQALGGTNVPKKLRQAVWVDAVVKRGVDADGKPVYVPAIQELADAKTSGIALAGEVAGLRAAVAALATGQGVDPARIQQAVEDGVAAALERVEVVVGVAEDD